MITRVPGTHDLLNLQPFTELTKLIRMHLQYAAFAEIMTPLIEPTELFQRSLGGATDIMSKELYFVSSPHAEEGDHTLCLRPEATASIMRAFLNAGITTMPWNVFTIGPMFRHERPQKGRYRQFHQASIEIIGAATIAHDVYLIMVLDQLFSDRLSLVHYGLLINFMGCANDRTQFTTILRAWLEQHKDQLCSTCQQRTITNPLRVFDCKQEQCRSLLEQAPKTTEHLCEACAQEWHYVQQLLQQLSISYSHQPALVRGLDYYSKTVFEFVSSELGAQNTFCGGGRYNQLAREIGAAEDVPSVGAAIGIERLLLLVGDTLPQRETKLYCIIPLTIEQQTIALHLTDLLLARQLTVQPLLTESSLKSMMRAANRAGAHMCILIGPDEQQAGTVTVKHMVTGASEQIPQRDLVAYLMKA
jgi:histidyl-tRNA synthetase